MRNTEVNVDDDKKVIWFKKVIKKPECEHPSISMSEDQLDLICKSCGARVNPIWWLKRYITRINTALDRDKKITSEAREIWKKLDNKCKFMCKYCHEVNTIDFKRLPSQAAITRGLKVIDDDYSDGYRVEEQ